MSRSDTSTPPPVLLADQIVGALACAAVWPRRERAVESLAGLSDREREVALAVGQGRSNAEIAVELHMSVATVKAHVSRVLTKLELNNRVQIALTVHDAGYPA